MAEVHGLLLEAGLLTINDIMDKVPPEWVEATRGYGKAGERRTLRPGKFQDKRNRRIVKDRPLKELDDWFAVTGSWFSGGCSTTWKRPEAGIR